MKKDNSENESEIQRKPPNYEKKLLLADSRRSPITADADQVPATSVNRFRLRSKSKHEDVTARNTSDSEIFKDKTNKDGYKVFHILNIGIFFGLYKM